MVSHRVLDRRKYSKMLGGETIHWIQSEKSERRGYLERTGRKRESRTQKRDSSGFDGIFRARDDSIEQFFSKDQRSVESSLALAAKSTTKECCFDSV